MKRPTKCDECKRPLKSAVWRSELRTLAKRAYCSKLCAKRATLKAMPPCPSGTCRMPVEPFRERGPVNYCPACKSYGVSLRIRGVLTDRHACRFCSFEVDAPHEEAKWRRHHA